MSQRAMLMVHGTDAREDLLSAVDPFQADVDVLGAALLIAVYVRPERTKSGLFLADTTRNEDRFQGKVGLVLKVGPIAFEDDATHRFGDRKPTVGDWVLFSVGDTFPFTLGETRCRIVEDVHVRAVLCRPDVVY